MLVQAFNELVDEHPDLTLTLVGEESPVPIEMAVDIFGEEEVRDSGPSTRAATSPDPGGLTERARERVHFAGRVSHEQAAAFYREADIFVFPSIFEAMPIPPIEAMAAGLPVVATSVGGTPESVSNGETGILVDRGDAAP